MAIDSKKLIQVRNRKYLNKDFNSLRADLLQYAQTYYADKIKDFSEASVGGMFLDLAAYVGDVTSFYLDHQFSELNPETAVESRNIENHLRAAGVTITGAAPAVVDVTFYIEVPAIKTGARYSPRPDCLPIVEAGTIVAAANGVEFELLEDVDFSEEDVNGDLKASVTLGTIASDGSPATFILSKSETCVSGKRSTQAFVMGNTLIPFRRITLSSENITDIVSVTDSENNSYYEVESLVQDTVFRAVSNNGSDSHNVRDTLQIIPAPHRFVRSTALDTRLTSLRFGAGDAQTLDNDILPDPSKFAVPLYGKRTFNRFTLDPSRLLSTRTLGVAPTATTITVVYRYGGGLSHNVGQGAITSVIDLRMAFPSIPSFNLAQQVRASLVVRNLDDAAGGEDAPTIDELKIRIPAFRNSQSRIVSKEDLIARVYTLPSNFGRVFRAGLRPDPLNPLTMRLHIISRNEENKLIISPDSLKLNLKTYLNQFRMISESIDILDAQIINLGLEFKIVVDPNSHPRTVVKNVIAKLKEYFNVENWQIDQPIAISDINNIIFNTTGVASVIDIKFSNISGTVGNREYSDIRYDLRSNLRKGMIIPPPGAIFEIRFPDTDIVGVVE